MTWKLDAVNFADYGVVVSKSAGVLDLPETVDTSIDWLNEYGRDYWETADKIKYKSHEILINCWIKANDYADFVLKLNTFFNAISSPEKRELTSPFSATPIEVYLEDEISVVRDNTYFDMVQTGVFNLKFVVSGDSQTKLITIYTAAGTVRTIVKYGSDARLTRELQGVAEINFQCEFNTMQSIGRGDYIQFGLEKYVLLEYPQIDKLSTNKFIYKLTFSHQLFLLKDIMFRIVENSQTYYYATMEDILDRIIENAERGYPGLFVKGTVDTTEYRNHQFNDEDCLSVLQRLAADYDLEYQFQPGSPAGSIELSIKKQIGFSTGDYMAYGKGNLLYKINRVSTGRDLLCTRLYAYGSDRNIPSTYGHPRLKLDTEPITREFFGMHVERTKIFEDIYPEHTGVVSSYTYTAEEPIERSTYALVDASMPFDLKEMNEDGITTKYLISGTTAKIHFNSGDMAGFEFEVLDYDHLTKTFYLVPFKEANGLMYPNATLQPSSGDQYKILDIILPAENIAAATDRLLIAANAYIDEFSNPKPVYTVETNPFYDLSYIPGDTVQLVDADFGIDAEMRIRSISKNIYTGISTLTLSWFVEKYKRQQLALKVAKLEMSIKAAKIDQVITQRGSEQTTNELKNGVINPIDEKIRGEKIRKLILPFEETIEPNIADYALNYASIFGQHPDVKLYTIDGDGNRILRSEQPYFVLNEAGTIDHITFGELADSPQNGFIQLQ